MSSAEEDYNEGEGQSPSNQGSSSSKKRRVQRACDICRRKKIRCDGGSMPNNRCSNCIAYNSECTYLEAAKKRGPPKGYVENLELRLEQMERVLKSLHPEADFTKQLGLADNEAWIGENFGKANSKSSSSSMRACVSGTTPTASTTHAGIPSPTAEAEDAGSSDDDERIVGGIHKLSLDPVERRFIGKSSGMTLVQAALDLKNEYAGGAKQRMSPPPHKRSDFWRIHPWELVKPEERLVNYKFPEQELMRSLVNLYFTTTNIYYPLLHRPTFERLISEGVHYSNHGFASTAMLVCALGARYSEDPRVLLKGVESHHSAGWKYFDQVQIVRNSLMMAPSIYDLQVFALSSMFLQGSSAPQASWTLVGIGIRLAQDVGAHRRKMYSNPPTVQGELFKRAFWVLVALDRLGSSGLGRPCGIHDEDFDLELPLEVDDEYWEHADAAQAFKQPKDKPSIISYFTSFLKLNQILAFALRTIYSINKSKILLGFVGEQWEQHIVAELDSALNKWIDSVPDHLLWDPNREDFLFFNQSASLYAAYYHLQILVHRPFIPSPRKPSPLSFPSLAICTNAARSCSHVVDVQRKRLGCPMSHVQLSAFTAGVVLLMNIWGSKKRAMVTAEPATQMGDVHKCMHVLKDLEHRWYSAGRLWDIMYELASVGDLPLPTRTAAPKRPRDSDEPVSSQSPSSTSDDVSRPVASNRRFPGKSTSSRTSAQHMPMQQEEQTTSYNYPLPMHSDDLGRIPLDPDMRFPVNLGSANTGSSNQDSFGWTMASHSSTDQIPTAGISGQAMAAVPFRGMDGSNSEMSLFSDSSFYTPMLNGYDGVPFPNEQHSGPSNTFSTTDILPHYTTPSGAPVAMNDLLDSETIAMWSSAPHGFELEDWGPFVHHLNGEMPGTQPDSH